MYSSISIGDIVYNPELFPTHNYFVVTSQTENVDSDDFRYPNYYRYICNMIVCNGEFNEDVYWVDAPTISKSLDIESIYTIIVI